MSMALGHFLNGVIRKTCGSGVVYTDWGRWLSVSEIGNGGANGNGFLAVEKSGSVSALTMEAMTLEILLERVNMGPLMADSTEGGC